MIPDPQKFHIGVIDLFAVLLPGALVVYAVQDTVGKNVLGDGYSGLGGWERILAFLVGAYVLGHFIFLLGSIVLDDHVYDRVRNATGQRLADPSNPRRTPRPTTKRLARKLVDARSDAALTRARSISGHHLGPLNEPLAINAYQWCKARLALEKPEALSGIQRLEADSKFFRSFVVALPLVVGWELATDPRGEWASLWWVLAGLALMALAFWRYFEQRLKAIDQAFWYIITLEGENRDQSPAGAPPSVRDETHAGGVVVRGWGERSEYVLVTAKDAPTEWVLPKGHIEPGERSEHTALREVFEEAGVVGHIVADLDVSAYPNGRYPAKVRFFLMEAVARGTPTEPREIGWFPYDQAIRKATYPETRDVLARARRNWSTL